MDSGSTVDAISTEFIIRNKIPVIKGTSKRISLADGSCVYLSDYVRITMSGGSYTRIMGFSVMDMEDDTTLRTPPDTEISPRAVNCDDLRFRNINIQTDFIHP